jgi:hypothetical protein
MKVRRCEDAIARLGRRVLLVGGQAWWDVHTRTTKRVDDHRSQRRRRRREEHENATRREGYLRPVMMKLFGIVVRVV